jgi:hypothetical protein
MEIKIILALVLMLSLLAIPVYAAKDSIACAGNLTANNYTDESGTLYINVTQLNSSILSSQRTMYQAMIQIGVSSGNGTDNGTLTMLNYTLGDEWAYDSVSNIQLLNSTSDVIQTANATYADGNYLKAVFNGTGNLAANANTYGAIMNASIENTTFIIRYLITTVDSNRIVTTSTSGNHYDHRINYHTPSDLDLYNVTMIYAPSGFTDIDAVKAVSYNGTTLRKGTSGTNYFLTAADFRIAEAKSLFNGSTMNHTWNFTWTTGEARGTHGGTGAGGSRPTVTPTYQRPSYGMPAFVQVIVNFFKALFGIR